MKLTGRLHRQAVDEAILHRHLERQAHRTDAPTVGSQEFVTFVESLHQNRRRLERK